MMRARFYYYGFRLARNGEPGILFIVDRAGELPTMSVTNDAENVVTYILESHPGYRIIYKDTAGDWGELIHEDGKFHSFAPVYKEDYEEIRNA